MMVPFQSYTPSSKCPREVLVEKLSHQLRPHLANLKSLTVMLKEGESSDRIMDYFQNSLEKLDHSIMDVLDYMWEVEKENSQQMLSKTKQSPKKNKGIKPNL